MFSNIVLSLLFFLLGGAVVGLYFELKRRQHQRKALQEHERELIEARHRQIVEEVGRAIHQAFARQEVLDEVRSGIREAFGSREVVHEISQAVSEAFGSREVVGEIRHAMSEAFGSREVAHEIRQVVSEAFGSREVVDGIRRAQSEAFDGREIADQIQQAIGGVFAGEKFVHGIGQVIGEAFTGEKVFQEIRQVIGEALVRQDMMDRLDGVVREVLAKHAGVLRSQSEPESIPPVSDPIDRVEQPLETREGLDLLRARYDEMLTVADRVDPTVHEALYKLAIVAKQVQSFTDRIGKDSETAIFNFVELLRNLNVSTIQATTDIVEEIKAKMALTVELGQSQTLEEQARQAGKKQAHPPKKQPGQKGDRQELRQIQARYEGMLAEIMTQFNLTVERKGEDITKLDHIREGVGLMAPFSMEIAQIASSTKIIAINAAIEAAHAGVHGRTFNVVATEIRALAEKAMTSATTVTGEMKRLIQYIEEAIDDVKTAMDIESRFVNSTITLLQDVVLSVVDSFIKLSEIMHQNLADSEKFRDDVNKIVINLQFEDICNQMSQHTVEILDSVQRDLEKIRFDEQSHDDAAKKILPKVSGIFTMEEERKNAQEALVSQAARTAPPAAVAEDDDDEVTFFDEATSDAPGPVPMKSQVAPAAVGEVDDDEVTFFDDSPLDAAESVAMKQQPGAPAMDDDDDGVTFFDEAPVDNRS